MPLFGLLFLLLEGGVRYTLNRLLFVQGLGVAWL